MTTSNTCPRCNAALAPGAQFCGACGLNLAAATSGAPQPPPPAAPQMPQMPQMPRSFAAGNGPTQQANINGEPADAYAQVIRAITAAGGEIGWQQAPSAAKFTIGKKDWLNTGGFTIKYEGDLQVQKSGTGQSSARLSLKINWGSYVPLGATTVILLLVLSMTNYYFAAMGLLFMAAILVYSAWAVSTPLPDKILKDIIHNLQGATPSPANTGAASYAPAPRPAPQTPPPFTPAPPAPPPAAPAATNDTTAIVEQIKQLAGLRDAGAISAEEFEAKKTELLKRI